MFKDHQRNPSFNKKLSFILLFVFYTFFYNQCLYADHAHPAAIKNVHKKPKKTFHPAKKNNKAHASVTQHKKSSQPTHTLKNAHVQHAKLTHSPPLKKHTLAFVNTMHLENNHHAQMHLANHTTHRPIPIINRTITPAQRNLIDFVDKTVYNLNYNSYRLGAGRFDTSHGIYVLDCSRFVDGILSRIYPTAYAHLVNASGADRPASQHYFEFFSDLSSVHNRVLWNKVEKIGQLRPGDILVFRYKKPSGHAQGHVMVIMDKPRAADNAWMVRVADSAPIRHSADTRQQHESGIGIGTLLLKPSPSGKPSAYAWEMGGTWRKNVKFAMARPLKMEV